MFRMQLYKGMEDDLKAARRVIKKLWGLNAVNEWNRIVNNRIAETLRGEAADTLPDLLFLDYQDGTSAIVEVKEDDSE